MIIVDVQRGGPSTGLPDQDRAGRPAARDVRPSRRVARCRSWRRPRRPTASTRAIEAARIAVRVPHAGDRAVRHVPVELVGAVEAARRSTSLPMIEPRFADGPANGDGFLPYERDEQARAAVGHARARRASCTASAGSSARTAPATSATTREPRAHDAPAPGEGRRHRGRHPGARGRRPRRRRRAAGPRLGLVARHDPGRRPPRARLPGARSPPRTCATSTRSRRTPATWSRPTRRC